MGRLRFFTAGESHGPALMGIIEGIPANLTVSPEEIDRDLKRRQGGFGRGGRMKIESDRGEILSGIRWGKTIGSPLTILIENRDFRNWKEAMSVNAGDKGSIPPVTRPRPGHADLAGALKYNQHDIRNILERSSARDRHKGCPRIDSEDVSCRFRCIDRKLCDTDRKSEVGGRK